MCRFNEFKLTLQSLPPGKHSKEFHLDREFFVAMESADILDANLDVMLDIDHSHGTYGLTFGINGTVTLTCDRCLDPMEMPIDTGYIINVEYGDSYDDSNDALLIIPRSEASLNVADMIYDTVELAIPIKHVHAPGQCNSAMNGLLRRHSAAPEESPAGEAGGEDPAGRQIDPRWEELRKLTGNN